MADANMAKMILEKDRNIKTYIQIVQTTHLALKAYRVKSSWFALTD
jgi:hypothetical protein